MPSSDTIKYERSPSSSIMGYKFPFCMILNQTDPKWPFRPYCKYNFIKNFKKSFQNFVFDWWPYLRKVQRFNAEYLSVIGRMRADWRPAFSDATTGSFCWQLRPSFLCMFSGWGCSCSDLSPEGRTCNSSAAAHQRTLVSVPCCLVACPNTWQTPSHHLCLVTSKLQYNFSDVK